MKKENIARFKKYVVQQNLKKKPEIAKIISSVRSERTKNNRMKTMPSCNSSQTILSSTEQQYADNGQSLPQELCLMSLSVKEEKSAERCFETVEKNKILHLAKSTLKELQQISRQQTENLVGLEISLAGRIKGAAKARRTTTGLSGSLKPQTILGSEIYSIYQKNVYTK